MSAFALFHEMRLGKTATAVAIAGSLYAQGEIERVLVVCPKSVIPVIEREFCKWADYLMQATGISMVGARRLKLIEDITNNPPRNIDGKVACDVMILNYESIGRSKHIEGILHQYDADLVICDEVHRLKSPSSAQSKALQRLGARARYRIGMTGTPVANLALDLFGIYRFLDPTIFGSSYTAFRARYANTIDLPGGGKMVVSMRDEMMGELAAKAHSIAHRATQADAFDVPQRIIVDPIAVELEPKARRAYNELVRESITYVSDHPTVTQNVLTRILRLQQLVGGFMPDSTGALIQVSDAKLSALRDYFCDLSAKAIVFAKFTAEVEAIYQAAEKAGLSPVKLDGQAKDRGALVERFQTDESCRVFVGQIQAASEGVELSAASETVFYSTGYSLSTFLQARERSFDREQRKSEVSIVAADTVDEDIVASLRGKQNVARQIVDGWKQVAVNV